MITLEADSDFFVCLQSADGEADDGSFRTQCEAVVIFFCKLITELFDGCSLREGKSFRPFKVQRGIASALVVYAQETIAAISGR